LATCTWQIPLEAAATAFLFAWLEAQVSAAVRLVPLGQTDGQRILADLAPIVCDSIASGLARADADIAGGVLGHAMASAQHETQYSRLFRS
jgi:urease accessory protein